LDIIQFPSNHSIGEGADCGGDQHLSATPGSRTNGSIHEEVERGAVAAWLQFVLHPLQLSQNVVPQISQNISEPQEQTSKIMKALSITNSINASALRYDFFLITLMLACFALSPSAHAVSPAPDGGYPGFSRIVNADHGII